MEKYYIYCSNNLAYHALLNNAILAKSITREDFQENSVSFFSEDHIFLTKDLIRGYINNIGISDSYYPVTLEIEDDEIDSAIPVRFVTLGENESITLSEKDEKLSDYNKNDNHVGAFVLGEIPITYLSGIIFDTDEHRMEFKKSSLDLWFPEDLFRVQTDVKNEGIITESILKNSAELIGNSINDADKFDIRKLVLNRIRFKAALYFGIDATNEWRIDSVKTNFDSTLIHWLDKEDKGLTQCVEKLLSPLANSGFIDIDKYNKTVDEVIEPISESPSENRRMFNRIIKIILEKREQGVEFTTDELNKICEICIEEGANKEKVQGAIDTVKKYLGSTMDPDETLRSLKDYPIIRSLMIFLDQQINADFMRRSTEKLNQNERRYTHIMFGFMNGMAGVERSQKSNRSREYHLEEIASKCYHDNRIINKQLHNTESAFMKGADSNSIYGLEPTAIHCFNIKESQEILLGLPPEELEKLYSFWKKSMKNDQIHEDELYLLKNHTEIIVHSEGKDDLILPIRLKKDVKKNVKEIEDFVESLEVSFNADAFKKHLKNKNKYEKFFKKIEDTIQKICNVKHHD